MNDFNKTTGKDVANAIDGRIVQIAKQIYNNAPFDRIVKGVVVEQKANKYTVKIQNAEYSNILALKGNEIEVGNQVICVIPNNQYNDIFILGILDI